MGLVPSWNGGIRLGEIVGKNKALEIIISGKIYDPAELLNCGFVNEITSESLDNFNFEKYFGQSPEHTKAFKIDYNLLKWGMKLIIYANNLHTIHFL